MAVDPLKARNPALLAVASAVSAQLTVSTDIHPWLTQAGLDPSALAGQLDALAATLRAAVHLTDALRDAARSPYLDASPTLALVSRWRSLLRERLVVCDNSDASLRARAAATEIRDVIRLDPLRLRGTLTMLPAALATIERLRADLPASVDAPGTVATGLDLLAALVRHDGARRDHRDRRDKATGQADRARAQLVAALRRIRRRWRTAEILASGELPPLALGAGAADVG